MERLAVRALLLLLLELIDLMPDPMGAVVFLPPAVNWALAVEIGYPVVPDSMIDCLYSDSLGCSDLNSEWVNHSMIEADSDPDPDSPDLNLIRDKTFIRRNGLSISRVVWYQKDEVQPNNRRG